MINSAVRVPPFPPADPSPPPTDRVSPVRGGETGVNHPGDSGGESGVTRGESGVTAGVSGGDAQGESPPVSPRLTPTFTPSDLQKGFPVTSATAAVEPTPGWVVAVLGVLLLPLAAGAFILSFVQLLPVMLFGGWDSATAWLGPVVLDVTAAAGAVMHVVSRDPRVRRWGLGLLAGGTLLSIAGNLAGHAIRTPDGRPRVALPEHMTGWTLPGPWQAVVVLLSIAVPASVAVLTHAFGAVLTAWLETRPAAVADPTLLVAADPTPADRQPTGDPAGRPAAGPVGTRPDPTAAPDPGPTRPADRPDPTGGSAPDPTPVGSTRPAADSGPDLRESGEWGTRPDPTDPPTAHPTGDPTGPAVGYPTDPTRTRPTRPDSPDPAPDSAADSAADPAPDRPDPQPTGSDHPTPDPTTRPDSESGADPTDPELTRLVARAREEVESGRIRPTAEGIRVALRVGSARAKQIRDALKHDQRHGLRAVS